MPFYNFLGLLPVEFGDWLASLTGECSLDASLYAGQPNSRISTNQLYLGFMVVVLGVYEIPQGNSHYILYVVSLIVLSSAQNQASVLPPAKQLCIAIFDIVSLASPKIPPTIVAHFQHFHDTE